MEVRLLDEDLLPVPEGEVGEIHIAGAGVARGYRNRPAETTRVFIPDPQASEPRARLYRTGDLARRLPDGQLVFHGRRDHQIKLMGRRIEPDEIAAAFMQGPGVAAVTVAPRDDGGPLTQLVAYVVPAEGARLDAEALRREVAEILPSYMVPHHVVVLPSLPLTPNGKINRAALPAVRVEATATRGEGDVEAWLVAIWSAALGGRPVRPTDDLFEAGADSLAAVGALLEVEKAFGARLPLAALFEAPTPARLAARLEAGAARSALPDRPSDTTHRRAGARVAQAPEESSHHLTNEPASAHAGC